MENDHKINGQCLGNERAMARKLPEHDGNMNGKLLEHFGDTCDTLGDTRDRVYLNWCLQPHVTIKSDQISHQTDISQKRQI